MNIIQHEFLSLSDKGSVASHPFSTWKPKIMDNTKWGSCSATKWAGRHSYYSRCSCEHPHLSILQALRWYSHNINTSDTLVCVKTFANILLYPTAVASRECNAILVSRFSWSDDKWDASCIFDAALRAFSRVGSHVVFAWIHCTDVRIHCTNILIECR